MVEWKKLGDVCEIKTGRGITQKDCFKNAPYPVISGGQSPMGMYKDYNRESDNVTISRVGAYAGFVSFIKERFYLNDKCFSVIPFSNSLIPIYLFHYLKSKEDIIKSLQSEGGVPTINTRKLSRVQIPIPSKSEQERIVSILDTFTSSIANLKEQIKERRKQYEHYRDQLFDLEGKEGVEMKTLIEIAELGTGSSNTNEELPSGKYPFFVRSQEVRWKDEYEFDETAIITSGDGVGVGKIFHYIEGKYALHQRAYRIHLTSNEVISKFLYYYFTCHFYSYIHKNAFNSSVTSVRKPMLQKFPIPIIPIERQMKIIYQLETFEASIANLEAQLKEREKQYEYYRNQLLTFE